MGKVDTDGTRIIRLEVRNNLRKFFNGMKDTEVILGGPAGTGKTRIALERQHLIQQKYKGARGLILRKFRSSMNETCLEVLNNEVFKDSESGDTYPDAPKWRERDQKYVYENASEIIVAGMDDPSKVMSSKYDWVYWNEAIEAKREEWEAVMSRLRNFKVPYQQIIGDTNPGPPSHWIKQFASEGRLTLLETSHKDNPVYWDDKFKKWTAKGEAYVNRILRDGLTGLRYSRLYLGKWALAEGMVYDNFVIDVHVVPKFKPPSHWPHFWCFDFGYVDPFVWQDWVEDPDSGNIYLYRELYHTQIRVEDACDIIKEVGFDTPPMALICDHDAENRATLEKEFEMMTLPAFKSIHPGIEAVKRRLGNVNPLEGQKPRVPHLFIMENCGIKNDRNLLDRHKPKSTQEEFDEYVWDTAKISLDKYKDMPVDKNNHGMDAMRYMVAFLDDVAIDPHEFETVIQLNPQTLDMHQNEDEEWDYEQAREELLYNLHNSISPF